MSEGAERYRADIDGLRAVAVLAVVGFHAFPTVVPGGFVGVDVFFVISGYLISGLVWRDLERGRFSVGGFYARRVRRIFPALVLMLGVLLAFGWFALIADEYRHLAHHVDAAAGFALNFALVREAGYFDTAARMKPLLHLWSLSIEEQFYLAWPLVLMLGWRIGKRAVWLVVGLLAASFAWNVHAVAVRPETAFFLPMSRFWELLTGGLVAWLDLHGAPEQRTPAARNAASLAGALGLGLALAWVDARAFPGWWALLPTVGAALCIWAGPQAALNRAVLATPPFVAVGLVSYPLYLWNWPLLSVASMIGMGRVTLAERIWLVAASFVLATATYRFVERPIRFARRAGGAPAFGARERALVGAMVGVACAAAFVGAAGGLPGRLSEKLARPSALQFSDAGCERFVGLTKRAFDYCRLGGLAPDAHELVALIGDSHARSLFPGVSEALAERGIGTLLLAASGCPPLRATTIGATEAERTLCATANDQILRLVESRDEIRGVILTCRGALWATGVGFGDVDENRRASQMVSVPPAPATPSGLPALSAGLRRTVLELEERGKQVTIVLDVPELGFEPRGCMERPAWIRPGHACEVERRTVDERQDAFRAAVFALARELPDLRVVDPLPLFCDDARCRAFDDGELLYDDDDHVSAAGSRRIAALLEPESQKAVAR
jgi:peptidoglycan/LPS O-acetylase OafA/YrhL